MKELTDPTIKRLYQKYHAAIVRAAPDMETCDFYIRYWDGRYSYYVIEGENAPGSIAEAYAHGEAWKQYKEELKTNDRYI